MITRIVNCIYRTARTSSYRIHFANVLLGATILITSFFANSRIGLATELLNINLADVVAIAETLDGIGPSKAQAIVDYRDQIGGFKQIEELGDVPGIGESTLQRIRDMITLDVDTVPEKQ